MTTLTYHCVQNCHTLYEMLPLELMRQHSLLEYWKTFSYELKHEVADWLRTQGINPDECFRIIPATAGFPWEMRFDFASSDLAMQFKMMFG